MYIQIGIPTYSRGARIIQTRIPICHIWHMYQPITITNVSSYTSRAVSHMPLRSRIKWHNRTGVTLLRHSPAQRSLHITTVQRSRSAGHANGSLTNAASATSVFAPLPSCEARCCSDCHVASATSCSNSCFLSAAIIASPRDRNRPHSLFLGERPGDHCCFTVSISNRSFA